MTARFEAQGCSSGGRGEGWPLYLRSKITSGFKAAIGRTVEVRLDKHGLRFMLSMIADYYPDVITALADAITLANTELGEPKRIGYTFDPNQHLRTTRYRDAIMKALEAADSGRYAER
jgi:hypothetical protein